MKSISSLNNMNYLLIQPMFSSLQQYYREWHLCRELLTQSKLSNLFKFSFCLCCSNSMRQLQGKWKDIPVVKKKNSYGFHNHIHSFKSICFQHWQWLSSDPYFLLELRQVARALNTQHTVKTLPTTGLLYIGKCHEAQMTVKSPWLSLGSFPQSHPIFSPITADAFYTWSYTSIPAGCKTVICL